MKPVRRKPGRPKLIAGLAKEKIMVIRLTRSDYDFINKYAAGLGWSVSRLIRESIISVLCSNISNSVR